ncbi:Uu.00g129810.m01.CDS01 [Anthostomella pinea]|uniref:Uu.00g129810.m01.CDS01 n=1 Tax=Anthostomella pinea TaxID=933095 RepID=A0AAI8VD93_9PEZI|nr:Uu.00g129810.m01.CDS01 [Anthostomella pinea]
MSAAKPVLLMVHGAWHVPSHYDMLKVELQNLGFEFICPALPTMSEGRGGVDYMADVQFDTPLLDQGREVVIMGPSYGGVPATIGTEGLGVDERRAQGKSGGFKKIIFVAGFVIPQKNTSMIDAFGGSWPDMFDVGEPGTKSRSFPKAQAHGVLFNDLPPAEALRNAQLLVPQ